MVSPTRWRGAASAVAAFGFWGLVPIYYRAVDHVSTLEILAHRVCWSGVCMVALLALVGRASELRACLRPGGRCGRLALTAALLATNWFVFIWAINSGRVLHTSLAYYINPLLNVALGAAILRERLSRVQVFAVGLAAVGVLSLVARAGEFPWASLAMASSFACYGILRKVTPVPPLAGFAAESLLLTPIALGYLLWLGLTDSLAFGSVSLADNLLLASAGVITAFPLVMFAAAVQQLTLTTVGFFQYIAPTLTFIQAVFFYGERFTPAHAFTFGCIWCALVIYTLDSQVRSRPMARVKRRSTV